MGIHVLDMRRRQAAFTRKYGQPCTTGGRAKRAL
jgi:hypothetical protein